MTTFDIDTTAIVEFCRKHHIRRLSLFGSRLRGDYRSDSDLDLLVEFEPGHVPGFAFVTLESELSEMFGLTVDLRMEGDLSPRFRDDVSRSAKMLYAAD